RLWREFNHDRCPVLASSLAFASLLALVPVSALLFALFSGFGAFASIIESIQTFLIGVLVPTQQEEILTYVSRFVENTSKLGVFGLIFFLITSVLLLAGIQRTFDAVWGATSKKNTVGKFATYASVLIVGSFLLSIGLNVTGVLSSSVRQILSAEGNWFQDVFILIFPTVFLFVALFFMIRFIPAARVATSSALIGALVGALLWEAARRIFVFWVSYVLRLSVVYGSLAVIPIFLIWLYLAWTIVLLSLEVAYVHQHRGERSSGVALWQREPAEVLRCGLELYLTVAGDFASGAKPPSGAYLAERLGITERDMLRFIASFQNANLLIPAGGKQRGYVPSRELSAVQAEEVVRCVFGTLREGRDPDQPAARLFDALVRGAFGSLKGKTIKDILNINSLEPETVPGVIIDSAKEREPSWFRRFFKK
ncbi:MAG: YihY family inner membrane protein, partial [Spirochaetales bacterium]|nr:YihY family inner membrane protein [Spirochaetales bacterium]